MPVRIKEYSRPVHYMVSCQLHAPDPYFREKSSRCPLAEGWMGSGASREVVTKRMIPAYA
jgi:hypothetical protein